MTRYKWLVVMLFGFCAVYMADKTYHRMQLNHGIQSDVSRCERCGEMYAGWRAAPCRKCEGEMEHGFCLTITAQSLFQPIVFEHQYLWINRPTPSSY